jgi:hypothetical protein
MIRDKVITYYTVRIINSAGAKQQICRFFYKLNLNPIS